MIKYKTVIKGFQLSCFALSATIFSIFFFGNACLAQESMTQSSSWGVAGDIGTSFQHTKGDTLTSQGFLLPSFGASAFYIKVISPTFRLKTSLGYRTRGGVAKVNAEISPTTGTSLGQYRVASRDHFVTNDVILRWNDPYWKVMGYRPFVDIGIRNDVYVLSNSKVKSNDAYFRPESNRMEWYRNRHHKPYVVGLIGSAGVYHKEWTVALEYYHQIIGSFFIPTTVRSNYSQINSRSIQLNVGYRF
jgi:hypothetical protein